VQPISQAVKPKKEGGEGRGGEESCGK